jgi:hypothetical protein
VSVRSVAFVPSAPLLVPQVAGGSAEADADLRAASLAAVQSALDTDPRTVTIVAPAPTWLLTAEDCTWDFAGFGVDRRDGDLRPRLPWALGIGAWLLDQCGWSGYRSWVGLAPSSNPGGDLGSGPVAVVAVGDGSACRTEKAPGHLDPRAKAFDSAVADCLARGDAAALAGLDETAAAELMCGGLPVWRWVAEHVVGTGRSVTSAQLVSHTAPYGVGYFVASWSVEGPTSR